MKIVFTFLVVTISVSSFGQYFSSDLKNETVPITWLGLDFTEARFIEKPDYSVDPNVIKPLLTTWNDEVMRGGKKYPLKKAFHRSSLSYELDIVKPLNEGIELDEMVVQELHLLYIQSIKSALARYDLNNLKDGIGLCFLVEAIDYGRKEFSGYMIAIDLVETRMIRSYYLKTQFGYDIETQELIQPFGQILRQFEDKIDDKK